MQEEYHLLLKKKLLRHHLLLKLLLLQRHLRLILEAQSEAYPHREHYTKDTFQPTNASRDLPISQYQSNAALDAPAALVQHH